MNLVVIAAALVANILGWVIYDRLHPRFGTLHIDTTDPEDVKMRLVIDKDIDDKHCEYVTLKIERVDNSRK